LGREEHLLDDPFKTGGNTPEFFQTLNDIDPDLQIQLHNLISALNGKGYDSWVIDEHLVFILSNLIRMHLSASKQVRNVNAVKPNTKTEIYKRLCMAKDMLQSFYMDKTDLNAISNIACLSIPQLVRQFKFVFHATPHQYLMRIRLQRAAELLKLTDKPVYEITWRCGFEDFSAFCRAFKSEYGVQPGYFRKMC
jgi:AraC family transcriptional regulator